MEYFLGKYLQRAEGDETSQNEKANDIGFFGMVGESLLPEHLSSPASRQQIDPSPDNTDPKVSAYLNRIKHCEDIISRNQLRKKYTQNQRGVCTPSFRAWREWHFLFFFCYSSTALAGGYSCVTLILTLRAWREWHYLQHSNR